MTQHRKFFQRTVFLICITAVGVLAAFGLRAGLTQAAPVAPGTIEFDASFNIGMPPTASALQPLTATLRLRHVGGTSAVNTAVLDTLTSEYMLGRARIGAPNGGVNPLRLRVSGVETAAGGRGRQVGWQGTLAPNASVVITLPLRVLPSCSGSETQDTFAQVVRYQKADGNMAQQTISFNVPCPSYSLDNVVIIQRVTGPGGEGAPDPTPEPPPTAVPHGLVPGTSLRVETEITNNNPVTIGLGIRQYDSLSELSAVTSLSHGYSGCLTCTYRIVLGPGETRTLPGRLRARDFGSAETLGWTGCLTCTDRPDTALASLDMPGAAEPRSSHAFVDLQIQRNVEVFFAPDLAGLPNDLDAANIQHKAAAPLVIPIQRSDLGDAPSSNNHFGSNMSAYPGVQANFPTVFNLPTAARGPRHDHSGPFHLGPNVSQEAEADAGPDQDPINNLRPNTNTKNRDRGDDGAVPHSWPLQHCATTTVPVRVFVAPQIIAYYQEAGGTAYLNGWVDSTRDGDWADASNCNGTPAAEHIIIDYPVDVMALGVGLHTIQVTTGLVPWPAAQANKPAWVRLTLSERPSNKTLTTTGLNHGDGRGYNTPFRTGETEDYLMRPSRDEGGGPDLVVNQAGNWELLNDVSHGRSPQEMAPYRRLRHIITYENIGSETAFNTPLTATLSSALQAGDIIIDYLPDGVQLISTELGAAFRVGKIEPGEQGRIVLSYILPFGAQSDWRSPAFHTFDPLTATVKIGGRDIDPANNSGGATFDLPVAAPILLQPQSGTSAFGEIPVLAGWDEGVAAGKVVLLIERVGADGKSMTITRDMTPDGNGVWTDMRPLSNGSYTLRAVVMHEGKRISPISEPVNLTVDDNLTLDPLSLRIFTDGFESGDLSLTPRGDDGRTDTDGLTVVLKADQQHKIQVMSRCTAGGSIIASLAGSSVNLQAVNTTPHGKVYTGMFTAAAAMNGGSFTLREICGAVETEYAGTISVIFDPEGDVTDILTGALLAEATVVCLEKTELGAAERGADAYVLWPAASFSQVNPQTTAANGYFSFWTPPGTYSVDVERSGYQPYRTEDLVVTDKIVRRDVALTPQFGAADYVIEITDSGFEPAVLNVPRNALVKWVNTGTADRHVVVLGGKWDSGVLQPGESYTFRMADQGTYSYGDGLGGFDAAALVVAEEPIMRSILLPLVTR